MQRSTKELSQSPELGLGLTKSQEADATGFISLDIDTPKGRISNSKTRSSGQYQNLDEREKELARREAELERREKALAGNSTGVVGEVEETPLKNWPHEKFALLHHDITAAIPEERQFLVRMAFSLWALTSVGLLLNSITAFRAIFVDGRFDGANETYMIFYAAIWLTGIPIAFYSWYYSGVYALSRQSTTLGWVTFGIFFAAHFIMCALILLGYPSLPCMGIIFALGSWGKGEIGTALLATINSAIWAVITVYSMGVLTGMRRLFMTSGKMQTEEDLTKSVQGVSKLAFKLHAASRVGA